MFDTDFVKIMGVQILIFIKRHIINSFILDIWSLPNEVGAFASFKRLLKILNFKEKIKMMNTNNTNEVINVKIAYTHAGVFHADDIFSSALLKLINPAIEIKRVFNVAQIPDDEKETAFVFDIGGGQFDHHQSGAEVRADGTPYAAFGLLWKEFGHLLVSDKQVEKIDRTLISRMDAADNGCSLELTSVLFGSFNPNWNSSVSADSQFAMAVDTAMVLLQNIIDRANAEDAAAAIADEAIENLTDKIAVLDQFAPINEALYVSDALFWIYPSLRGGWNIQTVVDENRQPKKSLPAAWLKTPPEGVTFVHKGLFLASAKTKEDALAAAKTI